MASKSTNKTVWTLALVGIAVFLAWKLWPDLKKLLNPNSSSGGASGGVGASSPYPYEPNYGQQGSGGGPSSGLQIGGGQGSGKQSSNGQSSEPQEWGPLGDLWNWISGQETAQGDQAVYNLSTDSDFNGLGELDSQGLPLEPTQNFNDLPSWTPDDPNAPWNSDDSTDDSSYDSSLDTISVIDGGDVIDGGGYNDGGGNEYDGEGGDQGGY